MITGRLLSRGVYFGGNANNGANCGFVYANSNNAPSNTNANIGSRQYFSNGLNACNKNKRGNDLATWQKNTKQKMGLVETPSVSAIEHS